jgi:hypothetical protein
MATTYLGVLDPVPPSVDQCIQVLVDPAQDGIKPAAAAAGDIVPQAWLLPRNVVVMTSGATWRPRTGVKRGREHTPVMPITGYAHDEYVAGDFVNLRFAGVTIDGIHDAVNAKSNPNAAARTSIQMHGVATVFCPNTTECRGAVPKFGDPVWVKCPSKGAPHLAISGVHPSFRAFEVRIRPIADMNKDATGNDYRFVGWLVDAGPSDRHEIRVHLDPHHATVARTVTGMSMSSMVDGTDAPEMEMATEARDTFSAASAPGVAVAALSAAAEVAGHPLPFGNVLIPPGVSGGVDFPSLARIAEEQEAYGCPMDTRRQSALLGTNLPIDDVTHATAATLDAVYSGAPLPEYPDAVTTVRGAITSVSDIPREHVEAGITAAGGAPNYVTRQMRLSDSTLYTSTACGVVPDELRTPQWQSTIGSLLAKYEGAGPVSAMSVSEACALAEDVRSSLI